MDPKTKTVTFKNPPVAEAVLGIQFAPLDKMRITDFGLLWQHLKNDFPQVQERDRMVPTVELKGQSIPEIGWRLSNVVELPRVWFVGELSSGGRHFIQIQPDRYLYNWHGTGSTASYPSYESNTSVFFSNLDILRKYIADAQLGELQVDQCELTYVNHIFLDEGLDLSAMATKAFTAFGSEIPLPGHRDRFAFNVSSWLDELNGRLHASLQPAQNMETRQIILDFRIIARGQPQGSDDSQLVDWFNMAHHFALDSFKSLTTSEMHKRWGILNP
ncbi:TIGR04255 family protein [bacterium]|nr:TIGR04255 family protein [bacterium]MBP9810253.1 TIGR04255 family protein [bacterium]